MLHRFAQFAYTLFLGVFWAGNVLAADISLTPNVSPLDLVVPCYGQSCSQNYGASEVAALPYGDFRDSLLPTITRILTYAMVSVAAFMFVVASFVLFTGFGEEDSMSKAKSILTWGIVGLAFAAAAYLLVSAVLKFDYGS